MEFVDQAGVGVDAAVVRMSSSRLARPSDDHVVAARIGHRSPGRLPDHPALLLRILEVLEDLLDLWELRSYAVQGIPDCGLVTLRAHRDDLRCRGACPNKKGQADQTSMPVRRVHVALGLRLRGRRMRDSRVRHQSWGESPVQCIDSGIVRTRL